jgi:hypothetical protein
MQSLVKASPQTPGKTQVEESGLSNPQRRASIVRSLSKRVNVSPLKCQMLFTPQTTHKVKSNHRVSERECCGLSAPLMVGKLTLFTIRLGYDKDMLYIHLHVSEAYILRFAFCLTVSPAGPI